MKRRSKVNGPSAAILSAQVSELNVALATACGELHAERAAHKVTIEAEKKAHDQFHDMTLAAEGHERDARTFRDREAKALRSLKYVQEELAKARDRSRPRRRPKEHGARSQGSGVAESMVRLAMSVQVYDDGALEEGEAQGLEKVAEAFAGSFAQLKELYATVHRTKGQDAADRFAATILVTLARSFGEIREIQVVFEDGHSMSAACFPGAEG